MIVRASDTSLLLITQPDHAALARRVMEHWAADDFMRAPRRASILYAIEEHDNGWRQLDAAPVVEQASGRILDFITAPAELRRSVWPRGVEHLAHHPWAAALVAQHAIHIYARYQGDPDWAPFFTEMEALRARYLAASGLALDALLSDYLFLRVADLISLAFCNGWTDEQRHEQYVIRPDASRLSIEPDPFDGESVTLAIRARELSNRSFDGPADAEKAFHSAPEVVLSGLLSGR